MYLLFFDVPWWLILVGIIVAYYFYSSRNYGYWESLGVPGHKPSPFVGTFALSLLSGRKSLIELQLMSAKELGRIRGGFMGDLPIIDVNDLDFIKEVYVKQFSNFRNRELAMDDPPIRSSLLSAKDQQWKNIRSILAPAFSSGKLKKMTPLVVKCSDSLCSHLKKTTSEVDVKEYMGAFTMDVIAAVAFGLDIDSQADRNNLFVKHARQSFSFKLSNPAILPFLIFPHLARFLNRLGILKIFPRSAIRFFTSMVDQAIEVRNTGEQTKKTVDFLQLMVNAGKTHDDLVGEEVDKEISSDHTDIRPSKQGLTHEEIVANGMIFMLAGYDTTATCLTFTTYALAVHQDVQRRLREEIDGVMEEQDFTNLEVYTKMPYLDKVISESLRMYPPVMSAQRVAVTDTIVKGIPIKKGIVVIMPTFPLHKDEEYWPQPDKFDPERFSPEEKAKRDPYAYAPFGQGPRNCIGMRLALTEIKIAMARIVRNFTIEMGPSTQKPEDMTFESNNLLKPDIPILVKFVSRDL